MFLPAPQTQPERPQGTPSCGLTRALVAELLQRSTYNWARGWARWGDLYRSGSA